MAEYRSTHQHVHTVSIPRDGIIAISRDPNFTEEDLRVALMLLSSLDGYKMPAFDQPGPKREDPMNFRHIDVPQIAGVLGMKKKHVKRSVEKLYDLGYLDIGTNQHVTDGYRFTF